eukprot:Pgem_evm1s521
MHKYTSSWKDTLPTNEVKLKHKSSWEASLYHIEKLVYPALVKVVHEYHNKVVEASFNKKNEKRLRAFKGGDLVKMRNLRSDGT